MKEAPSFDQDQETPCQAGVERQQEAVKGVAVGLDKPLARKAQPAATKGTDAVKIDLDG